ncbi:MAG: hypothetical protein ACXIU8_10465 [Alkalilacustris sp.]
MTRPAASPSAPPDPALPDLARGEKLLRGIVPDRGRYWRDHAVLAVLGMVGVGGVLVAMGSPHAAIGALGAPLAIGARAAYLASEALGVRAWLTSQRIVVAGGPSVGLLEVETVRKLLGDVQIVTRAGDKHLLRHIAEPAVLVAEIEAARQQRRKRARA